MSRLWLSAVLISLLVLVGCALPADTALVSRVIDGDTIVLANGQSVRYIGIDTPEMRPRPEAYAREAWEVNRRLVEEKKVRLGRDVSETDRYGRLLRYVYVDDVFVNAELVRLGLAEARDYPPDVKYQDYLEEMETEARRAKRGMWAK